jgi:hypothetical protein
MSRSENVGGTTQAPWGNIAKSLGLEPRELTTIRGASGLDHSVLSIGVDDKNKRILLVSAEPDTRFSAMMQFDVQATMPHVHVLVARPIALDLSEVARQIIKRFGRTVFIMDDIIKETKRLESLSKEERDQYYQQLIGDIVKPIISAYDRVALPRVSQIVSLIQQAAHLEFSEKWLNKDDQGNREISLSTLSDIDAMSLDRMYGVCPIPLYEFREDDWQLFYTSKDVEAIRFRLEQLGIFQYFFPPADSLALALIDRGRPGSKSVEQSVAIAPSLDHPFGRHELLGRDVAIPDLVASLKDIGYVAEGEYGLEVTKDGYTVRSNLKYRPRESFVSKLLTRLNLNLNVSPNDFIK